MQERVFRCDPLRLCDEAKCCRAIDTQPSLTLGDYIRLSWYTHESVVDIWKTRGNLRLVHYEFLKEMEFVVMLGLLHDPCCYLTPDYRCAVYPARPLECAGFPLLLLIDDDAQEQMNTHYGDYRCLQGVQITLEQAALAQQSKQIKVDEFRVEEGIIWDKVPRTVHVAAGKEVLDLCREAFSMQLKRVERNATDPKRTDNLMRAIRQLVIPNAGERKVLLSLDSIAHALGHVMFSIWEDRISEVLRRLDPRILEFYVKTTLRWEQVRPGIP